MCEGKEKGKGNEGISLASLSVSHDGPGAKTTEKMAPGPYILKRTGGRFFKIGSHSQSSRKCNFKLFLNILRFRSVSIGGLILGLLEIVLSHNSCNYQFSDICTMRCRHSLTVDHESGSDFPLRGAPSIT